MWYCFLETFSALRWGDKVKPNKKTKKMSVEKIKNRSVSREMLTDLHILLGEKTKRTPDFKKLKASDLSTMEIEDICDIYIAEIGMKPRGLESFTRLQAQVLKSFMKTSEGKKAYRKRQDTLREIPAR